ncbi:unannotated protein [freshwater metagenome]|uniref:Unannotated protein n=1 Tax=freshwater metagenome TaxID=449393 RepID=A0A6J6EEV8_9ZZZZ
MSSTILRILSSPEVALRSTVEILSLEDVILKPMASNVFSYLLISLSIFLMLPSSIEICSSTAALLICGPLLNLFAIFSRSFVIFLACSLNSAIFSIEDNAININTLWKLLRILEYLLILLINSESPARLKLKIFLRLNANLIKKFSLKLVSLPIINIPFSSFIFNNCILFRISSRSFLKFGSEVETTFSL